MHLRFSQLADDLFCCKRLARHKMPSCIASKTSILHQRPDSVKEARSQSTFEQNDTNRELNQRKEQLLVGSRFTAREFSKHNAEEQEQDNRRQAKTPGQSLCCYAECENASQIEGIIHYRIGLLAGCAVVLLNGIASTRYSMPIRSIRKTPKLLHFFRN